MKLILVKYVSVIITLAFVTYGQLVLKYEVNKFNLKPSGSLSDLAVFFSKLLMNVGVLSGLAAAVVAAFAWLYAINKFQLSAVYPLLSINFILVPLLSVFLFNEEINVYKGVGILVIVLGILVFSKGV